VGLYTRHNNLLGKLQLLDIYDLTDTALSRFIEDVQDRRSIARRSALLTKIAKVKTPARRRKPAKKKAATKQADPWGHRVVKRGKKAKKLGVGDSQG